MAKSTKKSKKSAAKKPRASAGRSSRASSPRAPRIAQPDGVTVPTDALVIPAEFGGMGLGKEKARLGVTLSLEPFGGSLDKFRRRLVGKRLTVIIEHDRQASADVPGQQVAIKTAERFSAVADVTRYSGNAEQTRTSLQFAIGSVDQNGLIACRYCQGKLIVTDAEDIPEGEQGELPLEGGDGDAADPEADHSDDPADAEPMTGDIPDSEAFQ